MKKYLWRAAVFTIVALSGCSGCDCRVDKKVASASTKSGKEDHDRTTPTAIPFKLRGKTYDVVKVGSRYELDGKSYSSLALVLRKILGKRGLRKRYRGEWHSVRFLAAGFYYRGERYESLEQVVVEISGRKVDAYEFFLGKSYREKRSRLLSMRCRSCPRRCPRGLLVRKKKYKCYCRLIDDRSQRLRGVFRGSWCGRTERTTAWGFNRRCESETSRYAVNCKCVCER